MVFGGQNSKEKRIQNGNYLHWKDAHSGERIMNWNGRVFLGQGGRFNKGHCTPRRNISYCQFMLTCINLGILTFNVILKFHFSPNVSQIHFL